MKARPLISEARMKEIAAHAGSMSGTFLLCRDMLHAYKEIDLKPDYRSGLIDQVWKCTRCNTKKIRVLSRTGHRVRTRYEYPDDYLMKGVGRLYTEERDALRLERITRKLGALMRFDELEAEREARK